MNPSRDPLCSINDGPRTVAIVSAISGVICVTVLGRYIISIIAFRRLLIPDYLIGVTFICTIAQVALISSALKYGFGLPPGCLSPQTTIQQLKRMEVVSLVDILGSLFGRFSVASYLLGVVSYPGNRLNAGILWAMMIMSIPINAGAGVAVFSQCYDLGRGKTYSTTGMCFSLRLTAGLAYTCGGFNTVFDIALSTLPIQTILRLQMTRRKKAILLLALGASLLAAIGSIIRNVQLSRLHNALDEVAKNFSPASRMRAVALSTSLMAWNLVEVATIVIASSTPTMRVLYNIATTSVLQRTSISQQDTLLRGNRNSTASNFNRAQNVAFTEKTTNKQQPVEIGCGDSINKVQSQDLST